MKKIILFFGIALSFLIKAQTAPAIQWQKSLGGNYNDEAYSIKQTSDGGYIIAGFSQSNDGDVTANHGQYDYWIVKLNSSGSIQWQKSLGGSSFDSAYSIEQTTDGGYIVVGSYLSTDGDASGHHGFGNLSDYWVVKLDSNGNIQWEKSLGGSSDDYARCVQQTTDGGYIIAGNSYSANGDVTGHHGTISYNDAWIVKLDSNGNIQWQKSLGGSNYDTTSSIQQTSDGGYILSGDSFSSDGDVSGNHGYSDCWIVKLDNKGAIQWQKNYGGSAYDRAYCIQQTSDGGYVFAGTSGSTDGDVIGIHGTSTDYWVVKLDGNGVIKWQKALGGNEEDVAYYVRQIADGGYVIAGYSNSNSGDVTGNHGGIDYWIVKLNNNGAIQWQKSLGGPDADYANSIQQTSDGGYIIAGRSQADGGDVTGHHGGGDDYWIVKLAPSGLAIQDAQLVKINIYPNPVKDVVNYSEEVSNIKITDISGKTVKYFNGRGKTVNIANLEKGIYFITAIAKSGEFVTNKIVKE